MDLRTNSMSQFYCLVSLLLRMNPTYRCILSYASSSLSPEHSCMLMYGHLCFMSVMFCVFSLPQRLLPCHQLHSHHLCFSPQLHSITNHLPPYLVSQFVHVPLPDPHCHSCYVSGLSLLSMSGFVLFCFV